MTDDASNLLCCCLSRRFTAHRARVYALEKKPDYVSSSKRREKSQGQESGGGRDGGGGGGKRRLRNPTSTLDSMSLWLFRCGDLRGPVGDGFIPRQCVLNVP